MPIISSGADSPSARAMPMMAPVSIPGMRQRQHVVGNGLHLRRAHAQRRLANRGRHGLERSAAGDDDGRQRHQGQHQAADQRRRARHAEELDEHRQAQQAEDDGRHGGQVVDVDLDQVGEAVARGELFQVHRRGHADREGQQQGNQPA